MITREEDPCRQGPQKSYDFCYVLPATNKQMICSDPLVPSGIASASSLQSVERLDLRSTAFDKKLSRNID